MPEVQREAESEAAMKKAIRVQLSPTLRSGCQMANEDCGGRVWLLNIPSAHATTVLRLCHNHSADLKGQLPIGTVAKGTRR